MSLHSELVTLDSTEGPVTARIWRRTTPLGEPDAIVAPVSWPESWTRDGSREAVHLAVQDGRIQ